jgi:hypothetical protein
LARAIGCSTGTLAELIADDTSPTSARYSRYVSKINDHFRWPPIIAGSGDAGELQYLLERLADADIELLRMIKDMDREEQRALVDFYTRIRSKNT